MTGRLTRAVNCFNSFESSMICTAKEARRFSRPQNQDACGFILLNTTYYSGASCSALEPMKLQSKEGHGSQSRISHHVSLSALRRFPACLRLCLEGLPPSNGSSNTASTDNNKIRTDFHPDRIRFGNLAEFYVYIKGTFLCSTLSYSSRMSFHFS